jgi:hypothetical protein
MPHLVTQGLRQYSDRSICSLTRLLWQLLVCNIEISCSRSTYRSTATQFPPLAQDCTFCLKVSYSSICDPMEIMSLVLNLQLPRKVNALGISVKEISQELPSFGFYRIVLLRSKIFLLPIEVFHHGIVILSSSDKFCCNPANQNKHSEDCPVVAVAVGCRWEVIADHDEDNWNSHEGVLF